MSDIRYIKCKIIGASMAAVSISLLIAFYYGNKQAKSEIAFLKSAKKSAEKNLILAKADIDRISALDEVYSIYLQDSKYEIQSLLDSIADLNGKTSKIHRYKAYVSRLSDSLTQLNKQNVALYNENMQLTEKLNAKQDKNKKSYSKKVVYKRPNDSKKSTKQTSRNSFKQRRLK